MYCSAFLILMTFYDGIFEVKITISALVTTFLYLADKSTPETACYQLLLRNALGILFSDLFRNFEYSMMLTLVVGRCPS